LTIACQNPVYSLSAQSVTEKARDKEQPIAKHSKSYVNPATVQDWKGKTMDKEGKKRLDRAIEKLYIAQTQFYNGEITNGEFYSYAVALMREVSHAMWVEGYGEIG
jgi:Ulp1 family protease